MMISTKGRYALRVMCDLAKHTRGEYVALRDVAEREGISEKYLESIVSVLSKAGLLEGLRGKGGGYRLSRNPEEYKLGEILRTADGSLAPVSCLESYPNKCEKASTCATLPVWENLNNLINDYLDGITLSEIIQ